MNVCVWRGGRGVCVGRIALCVHKRDCCAMLHQYCMEACASVPLQQSWTNTNPFPVLREACRTALVLTLHTMVMYQPLSSGIDSQPLF